MERGKKIQTLEKIGIFICECGPNIKDAIDLKEIARFAQGFAHVTFAGIFNLLCSDQGTASIKKIIKEQNLTQVVIAACSPKEHISCFRKALRAGGLNPYLLQIANIREQCAWVTKDKQQATEKGKKIIEAAVKRVAQHDPLKKRKIDCNPDVVVVGAGVAGISAARTLAQKNRKVYLLEKLPVIGGKVALYEEVFPDLECASCMLEPVLDSVLHEENIEVLTYAEVEEVLGFWGNFTVNVREKARFVDSGACLGCGACVDPCPVKVKNEFNEGIDNRKAIYVPYPGALPHVALIDYEHCIRGKGMECNLCKDACPFNAIRYEQVDKIRELKVGAVIIATGFDNFDPQKTPQYGYKKFDNVYTAAEFERILNRAGPTGGHVLLKDGSKPRSAAVIHCVGSRNKNYHEYCSGICCMYSLKFVHQLKKRIPDIEITEFHADLCLPTKEDQRFYNNLVDKGIHFIRVRDLDNIKVDRKDEGLSIVYKGLSEKEKEAKAVFDMVILAPAAEPSKDAQRISQLFDIPQDDYGFFIEEHLKVAPTSTRIKGVFVAGCAQGPKNIRSSIVEGKGAAGEVLSQLIPGEKLDLEPVTAKIDAAVCSGCSICIGLCPFHAIRFNEESSCCEITELLCRGCGICEAACPSGAINGKQFTSAQLREEIKGLTGTRGALS